MRWLGPGIILKMSKLAWEESGSGPPLVCVHGLGGWRWQKLTPLLESHFRVLTPFLRGFGDSNGSLNYQMKDLAKDVLSLVEDLDIPTFHLLGHSLGGMVAQIIAIDNPSLIRSLILVSTSSHTGRRAAKFALGMARLSEAGPEALDDPTIRAEVEPVLKDAFPMGPPPLEMLVPPKPHPGQAAAWRAVSDFSRKDRLAELACPVLVVHGTADLLIPPVLGRLIHDAIPGSKHIEIEGIGHSVQSEASDELAESVLAFLREVESKH
jgi:pimeloyl-ACP methyl ester carboxylesterase